MALSEKKRQIIKNALYFAAVLIFFVMGEIPQFDPLIFKAIPVIPIVVSLSVLEGDMAGGIFGFIAGLMVDTYAAHIFGLASVIFTVAGFLSGVLVTYLLQNNMRTAFILTFALSSFYGIISFYVIYGMWQVEGSVLMFAARTVPTVAVTTLFAYPSYHLIRKIKTEVEERRR